MPSGSEYRRQMAERTEKAVQEARAQDQAAAAQAQDSKGSGKHSK